MKKIIIHEEYCMGCRLCEVHCMVAHSESKQILKTFKEEITFRDTEARIVFEAEGQASFGLPCRHCVDAACLESCMTGALYRDEKTGAILLREEKCIGCNMCIMVCPYGVIRQDKKHHKIASKCDLCIGTGQEEPACVLHCPNEALVFEEVDEEESK